jgi:hypothetical protein
MSHARRDPMRMLITETETAMQREFRRGIQSRARLRFERISRFQ